MVEYSELADFIRIDVIHYMFTNSDKVVLVVCPDKDKADDVFNDIFVGFCQMRLFDYICRHVGSEAGSKSKEIVLKNGSRLQIISPEPAGWMCGMTANRVHVIEKQNYSKEAMDDILCSLYPTISAIDGEIFGI